ncbi:hypothetical protein [Rhizobium phage RHph_X2_25]|nr:hypothetical protein [Rhizobium phage RHph_X2_25]
MSTVNGWTIWDGGECPTDGVAFVDIRLRCGKIIENTRAANWLWGRAQRTAGKFTPAANDNGGEIVAYRKIEEAA